MDAKTELPPRKAQAEETRRRILEVAVEAFSAQHYDEVAVGDIASSAGVAHGLLFHYFKNKRGLYLAAMEEAAREFEAAHQVDPAMPPGAQMRQRYYNQFGYLARHRGLATRLVLGGRGADPEAWAFFEELRWREIDRGCLVLGLDPQKPALRMMLRAAAAAADAVAAFWHQNGQPFDVTALTDVLFEQTITALRGAAELDPSLEGAVERAIVQLHQGAQQAH
ncbi:TetR family transcriptional regulator [Mycobacterium sp. CVI_P3]|uniref:TetR family transcriptional regulator n=1 Tax=Mycobacterium pinniadriaticum TaxID=2994102 RepID=A0ABT3SC16_9MYCO|nr:TetR family transcriptional regulator [Mycobacterium pinniadriaticum]MCX2929924.1 TetR family transcriptional regulator [Mycobacterium pinniadriaticum]MCX2936427.1 TetR family transcriptional regulator [Mycobacterium pinniadriaticum]